MDEIGPDEIGPDEEWKPYSSLCWALTRANAYVERALAPCDLTSRQYRMLVAIAQGPVSATALARRIGVAPPSATIMVRGLIQRGAVQRTASREDQRRVWLSVTDEGTRLLDEAERRTRECLERIAEGFDDPRRAELSLELLEEWNPALDRFRTTVMRRRHDAGGRAGGSGT